MLEMRLCPIKLEKQRPLTSIELRCQLIFCPASQSCQFPGIFFRFFPAKKKDFLSDKIFLLLMIVSSSNQAQQCSSTASTTTTATAATAATIKRKVLAAKVLFELTLTSLFDFSPPLSLQSVKL